MSKKKICKTATVTFYNLSQDHHDIYDLPLPLLIPHLCCCQPEIQGLEFFIWKGY